VSEAGVIDGVAGGSVGFVEERFDLEAEARMIAALLATASVAPDVEGDLLDEAVNLLDFIVLPVVREAIDPAAAGLVGAPLVDAVELAACLGAEPLGDIVSWALAVLSGAPTEGDANGIDVFADCLGWQEDPGKLPPSLAASAVLVSLVAAANKALTARAATV